MGIVELHERLSELTRKILDGDESTETQMEFDRLGLQYQSATSSERDLAQ